MNDPDDFHPPSFDELPRSRGGLAKGLGCGVVIIVLLIASQFIWSAARSSYLIRAQVSEGLNVSHSARKAVAIYIQDHAGLPTNNGAAGLPAANEITGTYVSEVSVRNGEVVVTYGNAADTRIKGKTLVLSPDVSDGADTDWVCSSPDLPDKWLLSQCRSD